MRLYVVISSYCVQWTLMLFCLFVCASEPMQKRRVRTPHWGSEEYANERKKKFALCAYMKFFLLCCSFGRISTIQLMLSLFLSVHGR